MHGDVEIIEFHERHVTGATVSRAALRQFAFCSRSESDWANQFYHQQRTKGKSNSLATRALANKWVKVIFALWQKRETYNESFHLWDKARYALKARAA